jgi:DHA1 family multidrug resistance protein-like MFS transporter
MTEAARAEPSPGRSGLRGWRRTFWVVFVSNLVSGAGVMSFLPFFPTLLRELGVEDEHERALWSGVLFGAAPLSAALMGPIWGSIGDRHGRKLMVVRALLGLCVFVGAMNWARSAWELLFLRLGQGAFSGFIPPSLTLVSIAAPRERQGRVTSWLQTAGSLGTIAGPLLGALFLALGGPAAVYGAVALGSGASALLVLWLAVEDPRMRAVSGPFSPRAVLADTWGDLLGFLRTPRLREALVLYAAGFFALGATNPQLELFVEALWRGDPGRVQGLTAALVSAVAVATIVATPLWGRFGDGFGHALALRLSSALTALALALHALVPSYAWLLALRLGFGCASPGQSASAFGLAATETATERRGAAMGAVFSARSFALSAGSIAGGGLAALLGIRGLFVAAGAAVVLALVAGRKR